MLANRIIGLPAPFLLSFFISGLVPEIRREVQALHPLTLVSRVSRRKNWLTSVTVSLVAFVAELHPTLPLFSHRYHQLLHYYPPLRSHHCLTFVVLRWKR